jgi:hypothetical protein
VYEADGGPMDQASKVQCEAMKVVCDTAPTTIIGAAAMALFIKQLADQDAHDLSEEQSCALGTLSRALASMAGRPMPVPPPYNP